jgi:hypothetical protein
MDHFEQNEKSSREVATIIFKDPPPVRIAPIDPDIEALELEDPERWDGLS